MNDASEESESRPRPGGGLFDDIKNMSLSQLRPPPVDEDGTSPAEAERRGSSIFDDIKSMSVNKLRSREESQMTVARFQKKEEAKRPLSLQDDLKARLLRRHGAISGATDREQQARDSLVVQAARSSLPKKKSSSLAQVGFAPVNEESGGEESDLRGAREGSDSEDSRASDLSDESVRVPPPAPPAPPAVRRMSAAPPPPPPEASGRSGSMLDESNTAVAGLLSKAKARANDDDSDNEEWDD